MLRSAAVPRNLSFTIGKYIPSFPSENRFELNMFDKYIIGKKDNWLHHDWQYTGVSIKKENINISCPTNKKMRETQKRSAVSSKRRIKEEWAVRNINRQFKHKLKPRERVV